MSAAPLRLPASPSRRARPCADRLAMRIAQNAVVRFDAVLFDFGGVFLPSPFEVLYRAAGQYGVPPETVLATCFGSYDQDTDHPWHRLERGEISAEQALAGIAVLGRESGLAIDPIAVLSSALGTGTLVRDDVVQAARDVKASGLKTAVVTNNIKEYGPKWRALLPLDELFDVVVDSCEEGIRKPDRRIFELTLQRLGDVPAGRAVFLDDAPGNVAAAAKLGLHAIRVGNDHVPALDELRSLVT
jgi:epoxide hydrolase-like predicted phosphatase